MFNFLKNLFTPEPSCKPVGRSLEELLAIKSAKEWIKPSSPEILEAEHELALARIAFEDTLFGIMYDMSNYIKFKNGILTSGSAFNRGEESLLKSALEAIKEFEEGSNIDDDKDWWHGFVWENMKNGIRDALTDSHHGDCIANACTCMRCYAEEKYKIPYTANFNKTEGRILSQEYYKNIKSE
jgi:hypothetical protein